MRTINVNRRSVSITALGRVLTLLALLAGTVACTEQNADFYTDRTLTILVGSGPGGVTDTSARIIAGFFEQYLPGETTVIVQNMLGGGSVSMTNHLYRSAS